jgi:hypothetical protein
MAERGSQNVMKHNIDRLTCKDDYPLWKICVQAHLAAQQPDPQWDTATGAPLNTPQTKNFFLSVISKDLLKGAMSTDMEALSLWNHFSTICLTSDLSSKSAALNSLIGFDYSAPTMIENKSVLLTAVRAMRVAFKSDVHITYEDLASVCALVNLPGNYQPLRSTLEETKTNLTVDDLFTSLIREEAAQRTSSAHANRVTTPEDPTKKQCTHGREKATCYKCHPQLQPTCHECKELGIPKHRHVNGSPFCKMQQLLKKKNDNAESTANFAQSLLFNIDSGTSDHIVANKAAVEIYADASNLRHPIRIADGSVVHATSKGAIHGDAISLQNVLVCNNFKENLLSISKLEDQGYDTLFSKGNVYICRNALPPTEIALKGYRKGTSYHLVYNTRNNEPQSYRVDSISNAFLAITEETLDDLHLKFNHLNETSLKKMLKEGAATGLPTVATDDSLSTCDGCKRGKGRRGSPPKQASHKSTTYGNLFLYDIIGPVLPIGNDGSGYILNIIDDYTRYAVSITLKTRSESSHKIEEFDKQVFNQTGKHATYIRADNAKENKTQRLTSYCKEHGIIQQFTVPYHSSQNGIVERFNYTHMNGIRSMLASSGLSKTYWPEAARAFTHTYNRSPHSANDDKSPHEIRYNTKPDVSHFRAFGSTVYSNVHLKLRQSTGTAKLADRSQKCIFVGYSIDSKSYRLLNSENKIIIATYEDCDFCEEPTKQSKEIDIPSESALIDLDLFNTPADNDDTDGDLDSDDEHSNDEGEAATGGINIKVHEEVKQEDLKQVSNINHDSRLGKYVWQNSEEPPIKDITAPPSSEKRQRPPVNYSKAYIVQQDADSFVLNPDEQLIYLDEETNEWHISTAYRATAGDTPLTYHDIFNSKDKLKWVKATETEIKQIRAHKTWKLVPLPPGRKAIKCKWVFKIKRDTDGNITKYKARLCACGYSQKEGIDYVRLVEKIVYCKGVHSFILRAHVLVAQLTDYKEIYSPVARLESLRFFLAIAASQNLDIHKMDVTSAFLNGKLDEVVYMHQPAGFIDKNFPDHVCLILQNLYGLKQAPLVWHKTIKPHLKSMDFQSIPADPCIFIKWIGKTFALIYLHVDDLLIASPSENLKSIKSQLTGRFEMTDEGVADSIVGIKVRKDPITKSLYLSNQLVASNIIQDYNMRDCYATATPIEDKTMSNADSPEVNSPEWQKMQLIPYRECVGRLINLSRMTRPDLAYAVSVVSRFLHNPGSRHWTAVLRILRYLKGTLDYELKVCSPTDHNSQTTNSLTYGGYTDADWGGNEDNAKSTSGSAFFIGSSLVSWSSKGQNTTATSTTYAEYIAAYHAATECVWGRSFLDSFHLLPEEPTIIRCDNESAITLSKHHMINPRSKHFDTKYHYTRELSDNKVLELNHIPGKENCADMFTKPLRKHKFKKYVKQLGLAPRPQSVN